MYKLVNIRNNYNKNVTKIFWSLHKQQRRFESSQELAAAYVSKYVEENDNCKDYFKPFVQSSKTFSLILPPPNITGTLHLGHALTVTVEDVLSRWHRMKGDDVMWVPGMDHAGIATQVVVEKCLWQEKKKTRHDLGRDQFEKEVWKWKDEKAKIISDQLRGLGASVSWPLEMFSMDSRQRLAVKEAFIRLYDSGLIYRSEHLVNWSCILRSAISDIEVEHLQISEPTLLVVPGYEERVEFGVLTKFAYKLDQEEEIVVATTRPETILGDVAVAVNPRDNRHSFLIGKNVWHPFRQQKIPIISDDSVDPEFGTGAVKVTPAHDPTDFQVGKRHGLNSLQIIDEKGNLTDAAGKFSGVSRFHARNIILNELHRLNLLRGRESHEMSVPICSRSKDVVEYLIKPQWFIRTREMAVNAINAVKEGELKIDPPHFEKTWNNWLENIQDWCVSRQLWWGHRIPMYLCGVKDGGENDCWIAADGIEQARCKASSKLSANPDDIVAVQDEDVLDTWFSSALFPFSVFGWPQQTKNLSDYYPLSMMETGHDILFFWVSRMVMLGTQLTGKLPFSKILLHGIICDAFGRKMSKSLGNVITPENVIFGSTLKDLENALQASQAAGILSKEELVRAVEGQRKMFPAGIPACGVDALRFTLCSYNIKNHFINFDVSECNTNRLFCNKIWQASKFTIKWVEQIMHVQALTNVAEEKLSITDKWILSRLSNMVLNVNEAFEKNEFHFATNALKKFLYNDFCDVYLETTKRGLKSIESEVAAGHCFTLLVCLDVGLRTLAPFMPYLSQHLHHHLPFHLNLPLERGFPQNLKWSNDEIENDVKNVLDAVVAVRRLKKLFNVSRKHKPQVRLVSQLPIYKELLGVVEDLTGCDKVTVMSTEEVNAEQTVFDTVGSHTVVYLRLPYELRKTLEVDLNKLEHKRNKVLGELHKIRKMISAESYHINAPLKVQQIHTKKIQTLEDELFRIKYLENLQ